MLPNFDQIGRVMAEIVSLIERGVRALETIASIEQDRQLSKIAEEAKRERREALPMPRDPDDDPFDDMDQDLPDRGDDEPVQ